MRGLLLGCALLSVACSGTIPDVHVYSPNAGYEAGDDAYAKPGSGAEPELQGRHYCRHLEHEARKVSVRNGVWAWTFTSLSIGMAVTGTGLIGATPDDPTATRKFVNVAVPATAAAFGLIAKAFFDRSSAAEKLAGVAARQAGQGDADLERDAEIDRLAHANCANATSDWIGDRTSASERILGDLPGGTPSKRGDAPPKPPAKPGDEPADAEPEEKPEAEEAEPPPAEPAADDEKPAKAAPRKAKPPGDAR
ncbi:MAG: hypothetical protein KC766_16645 [Myxococcales bacterium]|nr:hypothetical protein [Myxococcales bacterium]